MNKMKQEVSALELEIYVEFISAEALINECNYPRNPGQFQRQRNRELYFESQVISKKLITALVRCWVTFYLYVLEALFLCINGAFCVSDSVQYFLFINFPRSDMLGC